MRGAGENWASGGEDRQKSTGTDSLGRTLTGFPGWLQFSQRRGLAFREDRSLPKTPKSVSMPQSRQLSDFFGRVDRSNRRLPGAVSREGGVAEFSERGVNMRRAFAVLILALLVQPLVAQQDAANPFKIVLGNSTIAALKNNPKGLVWPFETLGPNSHDGVTVYYDPSESLVTSWKANDGTMQNLFSLDVTDEILGQIENDYGLPAMINPSDRERIRGVLLRYVPPAGGAPAPTSAVGPIGLGSSPGIAPPTLSSPSGSVLSNPSGSVLSNPSSSVPSSSILENNRVTSNLNLGNPPYRPLGSNVTAGNLPSNGSDFYQNRPAPLQPQASEFGVARPSFGSGTTGLAAAGQMGGGGLGGGAPPPLNQPLATQATVNQYPASQPLLPPPVYNPNAGAHMGAVQNWQTAPQQDPLIPNRRPGATQFPQVSYNHYPDNQMASYNASPQQPLNSGMQPAGGGVGQVPGGGMELGGVPANWQAERQVLMTDLSESKQRSVFLLFMLFLLTGLCLYLSWLARGFYFRYAELADELRETFSATT